MLPSRVKRCEPWTRAMPKSMIFSRPAVGDDHVRRLDVAMDDAHRVRVGKAVGRLADDRERLLDIERGAALR